MHPLTEGERARAALFSLDPNGSHHEWFRVLAAAHAAGVSEGDAREWSEQGESFDARAFASTWRSIKPQGGIGPGTLFMLAHQAGWREQSCGKLAPVPIVKKVTKPPCDASKTDAARDLWDRHEAARTADPHHPYLLTKRVLPHFARQGGDDLLIGMFDCDSAAFVGLQTIAPDGTKRFPRGSRAGGAFHLVEWPEPLDARDPSCERQPMLIAEGWATAASLCECLPWCWCVCAFNEGNLPRVALSLARQYKHRAIVVCGDDDRKPDGTERHDGNIGRLAALQAADHIAAVTGRAFEHAYVLPVFSDAGASGDFNDMAHREGRAAVVDLVTSAIREAE